MDFRPTDERRMLSETLARVADERYPITRRHEIAAGPDGLDPEIWALLAELGAIGALFPEEAGGLGGAGFDVATVFEAVGAALMVEPLAPQLLAGRALIALDPEGAAARLAPVIEGRRRLALAHSEPASGYAHHFVETRAEPAPGGAYALTGVKCAALGAGQADAILVSARVSGAPDAADGIGLFELARDATGLRLRDAAGVDGPRLAELTLEGCAARAVGPADGAGAALESALGWGLLALSAEALGAMERCKALTLEYLRTREQFGRPIGGFQALQHRFADMLTEIEQARSSVIAAADAIGRAAPLDRAWSLSAMKSLIGRVGRLVAEESVQLHGGVGVTWDYPLGHYAKRLVMIDHALGDEDFHLERCAALSRRRRLAAAG